MEIYEQTMSETITAELETNSVVIRDKNHNATKIKLESLSEVDLFVTALNRIRTNMIVKQREEAMLRKESEKDLVINNENKFEDIYQV